MRFLYLIHHHAAKTHMRLISLARVFTAHIHKIWKWKRHRQKKLFLDSGFRGGCRISGKGVRMYKCVGGSLC